MLISAQDVTPCIYGRQIQEGLPHRFHWFNKDEVYAWSFSSLPSCNIGHAFPPIWPIVLLLRLILCNDVINGLQSSTFKTVQKGNLCSWDELKMAFWLSQLCHQLLLRPERPPALAWPFFSHARAL